jgi:hypothetical protein
VIFLRVTPSGVPLFATSIFSSRFSPDPIFPDLAGLSC